jgi:predicted component of type VI protein secretion system
MPFIEFESEVRAIGPGVLTVGSAPEAGWRIAGRGLDPVHVMLSAQPGGRALLIRGSASSSVVVNGAELVPLRTLLSFGDRVAIGTAELRYRRLAPGTETPMGFLRDVRRGRLYQLRDRSTIGRDLSSTVIVHEPDVSRLHAELIQRGEAYLIVPHGVSVTSVNGARLLAPSALQEGDEIAVGRTVLRFTTALPTSSAVSRDAPGRAPGAHEREAKAQTTFIGTIEAKEHRSRATRRRLTRAASIALVAIAAAAVIVSLYADAHTPASHGSKSQVRPASRRSPRSSGASANGGHAQSGRPAGLPSAPKPR